MIKLIERNTQNGTSSSFHFDSVLHHSRNKRLKKHRTSNGDELYREYSDTTISNASL